MKRPRHRIIAAILGRMDKNLIDRHGRVCLSREVLAALCYGSLLGVIVVAMVRPGR